MIMPYSQMDIVDITFYEMISLSYFIACKCIYNVFVESFLNHILEIVFYGV